MLGQKWRSILSLGGKSDSSSGGKASKAIRLCNLCRMSSYHSSTQVYRYSSVRAEERIVHDPKLDVTEIALPAFKPALSARDGE